MTTDETSSTSGVTSANSQTSTSARISSIRSTELETTSGDSEQTTVESRTSAGSIGVSTSSSTTEFQTVQTTFKSSITAQTTAESEREISTTDSRENYSTSKIHDFTTTLATSEPTTETRTPSEDSINTSEGSTDVFHSTPIIDKTTEKLQTQSSLLTDGTSVSTSITTIKSE